MRAVHSLLALVVAVLVGAMAAAANKMVVAGAAAAVVGGTTLAVFAWRQSVQAHRPSRRVPLPRVLAAAAMVCYMLSTLTFRGRTSSDIAANPLDSAGLLRVAFLAGAALLALVTVRVCMTMRIRPKPLPPAAKIYMLYAALAVASIAEAKDLAYAMFSVADLVIAVLVGVVAAYAFRGNGLAMLRVALGFMGVLVATTLVGVLVAPSRALVPSSGPIPFRLTGLIPDVSFNSLGLFGLFFFAAGLAGMKPRRTLITVALALVFLSQYRTGYIACPLMLLVYLLSQRGFAKAIVASGVGIVIALLAQTAGFASLWARGSTSQNIASLSGRADYWHLAFAAVARSPIIGLGLRSGTRFEVLVNSADSSTSTVHNTWVEALVGVGALGLAVLVAAFLTATFFAVRRRHTQAGLMALLLLVAFLVRSATGTSFEIGGLGAPVFIAAIFLAGGPVRTRAPVALPETQLELAPIS